MEDFSFKTKKRKIFQTLVKPLKRDIKVRNIGDNQFRILIALALSTRLGSKVMKKPERHLNEKMLKLQSRRKKIVVLTHFSDQITNMKGKGVN